MAAPSSPTVHVLTLGCARNEVDSEELAGRLAVDGFRLVDEPEAADAVLVNTCGFIEAAKKDSVDALLAAADLKDDRPTRAVLAVGCLAERYGAELADAMPEADAVLGFDAYADVAQTVRSVLAGERPAAHTPRDRRRLLPLTPVDRPTVAGALAVPGHGPATGPRPLRHRLAGGATAPVKIASGCDRRCTFCAIPRFRGAYLSRPVAEVVAEARWLVSEGVREVFLVSENTTSYGKDLGDLRLLEQLLVELSSIDGLEWIRVSYLQPAELRPSLVAAIAGTAKVVPYFDLSFQHAAPGVLRRMRRFGDPDAFLGLLGRIRAAAPRAGIRSNVICGFPGEADADLGVLHDFLVAAELDAVGVFGYSDEDGTEAARLEPKLSAEEVDGRRSATADLVDELTSQRAAARLGEPVRVLVEEAGSASIGRAAHQGPEVDGTVRVLDAGPVRIGEFVDATVVDSEGVDLVAEVRMAG